jgi:hypothetical protein
LDWIFFILYLQHGNSKFSKGYSFTIKLKSRLSKKPKNIDW